MLGNRAKTKCTAGEGEVVIFDDAYEHEAWNRTPQTRVVLFVDFRKPLRRHRQPEDIGKEILRKGTSVAERVDNPYFLSRNTSFLPYQMAAGSLILPHIAASPLLPCVIVLQNPILQRLK